MTFELNDIKKNEMQREREREKNHMKYAHCRRTEQEVKKNTVKTLAKCISKRNIVIY